MGFAGTPSGLNDPEELVLIPLYGTAGWCSGSDKATVQRSRVERLGLVSQSIHISGPTIFRAITALLILLETHDHCRSLASFFCTACALTQEHQELELEEDALFMEMRTRAGPGMGQTTPYRPKPPKERVASDGSLATEEKNNGQRRR